MPLCPASVAAVTEPACSLASFLCEQVSGRRTFAPAGLGPVVVFLPLGSLPPARPTFWAPRDPPSPWAWLTPLLWVPVL